MIDAIQTIDKLPYELRAALLNNAFFCDIPVAIHEEGNVIQEIKRLQAAVTEKGGKWGVAVIVLQCVADDGEPELSFGPLKLKPGFQVLEQVAQNNSSTGTKKSARKIARKIRDVIKPLQLPGLCTQFVFEENCIVPVPMKEQNLVSYQVECHTHECDTEQLDQVAMPLFQLDNVNALLTLTCKTAGAEIWYTLDDTYPVSPKWLTGSTAQIYDQPIAIPPQGFTIRAAAVMQAAPNAFNPVTYVGSSPARAVVTPQTVT